MSSQTKISNISNIKSTSNILNEKQNISGKPTEQFALSAEYREATQFFDKFDRYDIQEQLAWSSSNWLLSIDDYKVPCEEPSGIISELSNIKDGCCIVLFPYNEKVEHLDYRDIHQIIREITIGIFGANQIPGITLEANFDQSSSCQLPPAYQNTRIGQMLIELDYSMKSLWHGSYFSKDLRSKFAERWRLNFEANQFTFGTEGKKSVEEEFMNAGINNISNDLYFAKAHEDLPEELEDSKSKHDLIYLPDVSLGTLNKDLLQAEREYFMSLVEKMIMQITLFQKSIHRFENIFTFEESWNINSSVKIADESNFDINNYKRISSRLQAHREMLKKWLPEKPACQRLFYILGLVAFLAPFLIGLRKRMRIPQISNLLPNMTGEAVATERELPPLILRSDTKSRTFFYRPNQHFNLHGGIQLNIESPSLQNFQSNINESLKARINQIAEEAIKMIDLESYTANETYPARTITLENGKKYYVIPIMLETYYPQSPQKPLWIRAICEETIKLRVKRLPISENHIHEQFKKYFGLKEAIKNKNFDFALSCAARRGLICILQTLCKKCPLSRLAKQDDDGWSLMHHAAMNNRVHAIGSLILHSMDVNVRRYNTVVSAGPTPIHMAILAGNIEAVTCLVCNYANLVAADINGWSSIHYAVFYDHVPIIKILITWKKDLLELTTKNPAKSPPILLTCAAGSLDSFKTLIQLGARISRQDSQGNGVVQIAALNYRTNILDYLINYHPEVEVWKLLIQMSNTSDECSNSSQAQYVLSSVRSLEILTNLNSDYWQFILETEKSISTLINLMENENLAIASTAVAVLCNISHNLSVKQALSENKAIGVLIKLLGYKNNEIQSRAAVVLGDLSHLEQNQEEISRLNGIEPLVNLLSSTDHNVLVNCVTALRVLCTSNRHNQNSICAQSSSIPLLVSFLKSSSDVLQAAASSTIAELGRYNYDIQCALIDADCVEPIYNLIRSRGNVHVQVMAASAVESLATDNPISQTAFIEAHTQQVLLHLLKIWSTEVKEKGAMALWALAGRKIVQQKFIADQIGIPMLIELMMNKSAKLILIACKSVAALAYQNIKYQLMIGKESGIKPLVRLLKYSQSNNQVFMEAVKTVSSMCLGRAHQGHNDVQIQLANEGAVEVLKNWLIDKNDKIRKETNGIVAKSEEYTFEIQIQIEVSICLATLCLDCRANESRLASHPAFNMQILANLFYCAGNIDSETQLQCLISLTRFAYNNTQRQYIIYEEFGSLSFNLMKDFIDSSNPLHVCYASFQIVILARNISNMDQVSITSIGITNLVEQIASDRDDIIILASSLMASLCCTRAGLSDAAITVGVLPNLIKNLTSTNAEVEESCAVCLGYLTFNRTALRILLKECRKQPEIFRHMIKFVDQIDAKINQDFVDEFEKAQIIGLPYQYLVSNGGPPIVPPAPSSRMESRNLKRLQSLSQNNRSPNYLIQKSRMNTPLPSEKKINNRVTSAPNLRHPNRLKENSFVSIATSGDTWTAKKNQFNSTQTMSEFDKIMPNIREIQSALPGTRRTKHNQFNRHTPQNSRMQIKRVDRPLSSATAVNFALPSNKCLTPSIYGLFGLNQRKHNYSSPIKELRHRKSLNELRDIERFRHPESMMYDIKNDSEASKTDEDEEKSEPIQDDLEMHDKSSAPLITNDTDYADENANDTGGEASLTEMKNQESVNKYENEKAKLSVPNNKTKRASMTSNLSRQSIIPEL